MGAFLWWLNSCIALICSGFVPLLVSYTCILPCILHTAYQKIPYTMHIIPYRISYTLRIYEKIPHTLHTYKNPTHCILPYILTAYYLISCILPYILHPAYYHISCTLHTTIYSTYCILPYMLHTAYYHISYILYASIYPTHCKLVLRTGILRKGVYQWWANLDQDPKDLDTTIFRDLSPTPIP